MGKFVKSFKAFLHDEDASMTVEFVIWIPWLLFYLVFTTSAYLAMDSRLEAMRASITLTDITSRVEVDFDAALIGDLDTMFQALTPSATDDRLVRISRVDWVGGAYVVAWTFCLGDVEPLEAADLVDNDNLAAVMPPMADLSSILLVETYVPYTPVSEAFGLEPVVWANRKVVTPRFVISPTIAAGVDQLGCGTVAVE